MFKVGEYIAFKPDLVLDEKYGTVTYSKWLDVYSEDVLKVVRITTAGTACCVVVATRHTNNLKKEVSTIHESMIVRPKFNIGDSCYIKENFLKELFKAGGICQRRSQRQLPLWDERSFSRREAQGGIPDDAVRHEL
jgi:hypothetical protein